MEFAFSKRVALASPVTLWSVLKTVAFSWQQDVLTNEAKTLFDLSRELYSRLATTASHIEKLGRTIERSVKDYNAFVGSLERQVLPTARKLGALDESKVLAPLRGIEEAPRELTAYELVSTAGADLDPELRRQLASPAPTTGRSRSADSAGAQTTSTLMTLPAGSRNHAMSGPCPLSRPRATPRSSVPKSFGAGRRSS